MLTAAHSAAGIVPDAQLCRRPTRSSPLAGSLPACPELRGACLRRWACWARAWAGAADALGVRTASLLDTESPMEWRPQTPLGVL